MALSRRKTVQVQGPEAADPVSSDAAASAPVIEPSVSAGSAPVIETSAGLALPSELPEPPAISESDDKPTPFPITPAASQSNRVPAQRPASDKAGAIEIENNVYVDIAFREAASVPGVVQVRGKGLVDGQGDKYAPDSGTDPLNFNISLRVEYGKNIPALADQVRRRIGDAVYHITGRVVRSVDVHIDKIIIPEGSAGRLPAVSDSEIRKPGDDASHAIETQIDF